MLLDSNLIKTLSQGLSRRLCDDLPLPYHARDANSKERATDTVNDDGSDWTGYSAYSTALNDSRDFSKLSDPYSTKKGIEYNLAALFARLEVVDILRSRIRSDILVAQEEYSTVLEACKTHVPVSCPIGRLPEDVLTYILYTTSLSSSQRRRDDTELIDPYRTRLLHVCRRWREIIHSNGSFWVSLRWWGDDDGLASNRVFSTKQLQQRLELTGDAPLAISLESHRRTPCAGVRLRDIFIGSLLPNSNLGAGLKLPRKRLKKLTITFLSVDDPEVVQLFYGLVKNVEEVVFDTQSADKGLAWSWNFHEYRFELRYNGSLKDPVLKRARVPHQFLDVHPVLFRNVKRLVAQSTRNDIPAPRISLHNLCFLTFLELRSTQPNHGRPEMLHTFDNLDLPSLKYLVFHNSFLASECAAFVHDLKAPLLCSFTWCIRERTRDYFHISLYDEIFLTSIAELAEKCPAIDYLDLCFHLDNDEVIDLLPILQILPKLRSLKLECRFRNAQYAPFNLLLDALATPIFTSTSVSTSSPNRTQRQRWLCPMLQHLKITGSYASLDYSYDGLLELVRGRYCSPNVASLLSVSSNFMGCDRDTFMFERLGLYVPQVISVLDNDETFDDHID